MSFFESEYFLNSSNDEVGNEGEDDRTYPITDTLPEVDNTLSVSISGDNGDISGGHNSFGMYSSDLADGRGSIDVDPYDMDQPSLMLRPQSPPGAAATSSLSNGANGGSTSSNSVQQQQTPIVSFSRATFKSSYLGVSAHLGRSSTIASMMGVSGMAPTTPRIGGVRAIEQEKDGDDDFDDTDGDEKASSRKSKKEKKKKKDKDKGATRKEKKSERRDKKIAVVDDENVHPILSNAQDSQDNNSSSNITREDLAECVDNMCTEESVLWTMKIWAIEVGNRLGIDIQNRPDMKNTLRELVLERAMAYVPNTQTQSQGEEYSSIEAGNNDNHEYNGDSVEDADVSEAEDNDKVSEKSDSSYSLGPKRKSKAKSSKKSKANTTKPKRTTKKSDTKADKKQKKKTADSDGNKIENKVASMVLEDGGVDDGQLLPDEDELSSVKSDASDSSFDSSDSEDSVASGGEVLGDVRGRRQATKDKRLKKGSSAESTTAGIKKNDELETFKKLESGNTEGLVSAAEVLNNQKDSEEIEWASRKLTKAALRQLTAGDRERMEKTKQEAIDAKKFLLDFCDRKGFDLHSDFIKDVIKHHKLDPTAWRGTAWQGPGEIENYLFEDDETLMEGHDEWDVIEEIAKIDEDEIEEEGEELEVTETSDKEATTATSTAPDEDIPDQLSASVEQVTAKDATENGTIAAPVVTPSPFMLAQMQQKLEQDHARAELLQKQQQQQEEQKNATETESIGGDCVLSDMQSNHQVDSVEDDAKAVDGEEEMIEMSDDSDDDDDGDEEDRHHGATEKIIIEKDKTPNQGSPDSLVQIVSDSPTFSQGTTVKKSLFDDTPSIIQSTVMRVNIQSRHALLPGLKNMGMKKVVLNNPRAQAKAKLMMEAMKQSNVKKEERWKKNNEGWISSWSIEENMRVENALSKLLALYMQKDRLRKENEALRSEKREQERMIRLAENEARWRAAAELGDDDEAEFDADAPMLNRRKYIDADEHGSNADGEELDEEEQLARMGSDDDIDSTKSEHDDNDMLRQENLDADVAADDAADGVSGSTQLEESQTLPLKNTLVDGEESDDEVVVRHAATVTYGKKVTITDEDIDNNKVSVEANASKKEDEEEEKEQIPEDPIERAKYERKKALARSQAYRLAVLEEERKNKRAKKSTFFEDEAEEDEEEGLMGGLEDYGFGSNKKDNDADDEAGALKVRADDFANIVDELSDDEGDEDAGDAARAVADLKRDQQQTKAVIDAVIYGKDKFKTLRNQGAILNEDEKAVAMRNNDGNDDGLDDELEEFDDEAYYLQKMKARDEELQKEAEKQRLRELEEEEAEAEEAEAVNVSEMNEEERRQHELDRLVHNKISKEFQMKARMKAKMRKAQHREKMLKEAQAAAAGVQLPQEEQPMSELLTRKLAQMNGEDPDAAVYGDSYSGASLRRSSSMGATDIGASRAMSGSVPSRASSWKGSGNGGRIGMTINTNFDANSNGPPSLNRQDSFSSTGSGFHSSRSGSNDNDSLIDNSAFIELNNSLSILNSGHSSSGFPKPLPLKRSSSFNSTSEGNNHELGIGASADMQPKAQYKSSMYKGTINQDELDGGYGLGMALTKKRKEELQSTQGQQASLFNAVTSNGFKMPAMLERSVSASAGGSDKTLKRIRPTSSTVTVNNRSFIFGSDNSRTGFGASGGSMSGFGGGEESNFGSNMGVSRSMSTSSGPSLFSKIADAANKKDRMLKKSSSLIGMRNF